MDPNIPVQPMTPSTPPVSPTQTPVPPLQPIPVVPPPAKKVSGVLIAGLILLFVSVLALVGYYFVQTNGLKVNISTPTPLAVASPSPIATTDPTADWKTYTSTKANYSFQYPQEWPLVNVPINTASTSIENLEFTPKYDPKSGDSEIAVILVFKDNRIKTLDDYKNTFIKGDPSITNVQDTSVATEKAISYKLSGGIPPLPIIEYAIVNNNNYYVIRLVDSLETNKNLAKNEAIFDQILSTFQFTNTQSTSSATPTATPL